MTQANIDINEINKFNAIAQEWWDPDGPFKPLHAINPLRLEFIKQHAALSKQTILDVGCGGGILTESLAQAGAYVTGIDLSENALAIAKQHAATQNLNIHYENSTVENLATQQPASCDVVTCMELLEHVPDPASVINACASLTRPGGKLFFSTINRTWQAYLLTIIGTEYLLKWLPRGTHDYAKFIRPAELANDIRQAGLQLKMLKGITYKPLSQSFVLSDNVTANYLIYCEKPL